MKELVAHPALGELQMAEAVQVRVLVLHAAPCWPRLAVCASFNIVHGLTFLVFLVSCFLATVLCIQRRGRYFGLNICSTSIVFFALPLTYVIGQGGAQQASH